MKSLCFLVLPTGMAQHRFNFFSLSKDKRFVLRFEKKAQGRGREGRGELNTYGQNKATPLRELNTYGQNKATSLEVPEVSVTPHRNSTFFLEHPLDILHAHTISSIHLEIPCLHNPQYFFLE